LKPRGNAPKRYTPDDYVNRGKKVVIEEDETPPRRSTLRKMRKRRAVIFRGGGGAGAGATATAADEKVGRPEAAREEGTSRRIDAFASVVNSIFLSIVL
jgi:hypothetical protein